MLLSALAEGPSLIQAQPSAWLDAMVGALRAFGVAIERDGASIRVAGRGLLGLTMPKGSVDCGRSTDGLALVAGALAGQPFGTRLGLSAAPPQGALEHLIGALRARGVPVSGTRRADGALAPPLAIAPRLADEPLHGIECELPEPDACAKSALLISGLFSEGATAVSEPLLSPDHTERMLSAMGVPIRRVGSMAGFDPSGWSGRLTALPEIALPGDPAIAAGIAAVASTLAESRIALRGVSWNPTRTGFFDALHLLGGRLLAIAKGDRAGLEPVAELQVGPARLRGGAMGGEIVFRCGAALPALCVLGAHCAKGLELLDADAYAPAGDPIWRRFAELLKAFGAASEPHAAGLLIAPARTWTATEIDVSDDVRLTWPAVLCALAAEGETRVHNVDHWLEDHGSTIACLRSLGAQIEVGT